MTLNGKSFNNDPITYKVPDLLKKTSNGMTLPKNKISVTFWVQFTKAPAAGKP